MYGIIQKKQGRRLFYSLLAVLLGLCFIRYSLQVNIPQVVLLAVALLIIALGDKDEIMAMCVCCIPLYTSFKYIYAILLGMVTFAAKNGKGIRVNRSIVPVFLMVLWEVLHCFGGQLVITQFIGMCLPILMLMLLMCSGNIEFDYDFIVRALTVTVIGMCITLLGKLVYVARFNLVEAFYNLRRLGLNSDEAERVLQVAGGELNPNMLGILCVLGLTGLMQIRTAGRGTGRDVPMAIFLLVFGVMTASRTFLVCLLLMALLMLFSQKGEVSQKLKFLAGVIAAGIVALILLRIIMPNLLEFYFGRFTVEDVTTGRLDLMAQYHEFIMSQKGVLFFGIGLHNFDIKVLETYHVSHGVPHNGIQEIIIAWGLPGLGLFTALCLTMLRRSRRVDRKHTLINYIPLLVILFKAQAGQLLNSPHTMLALTFAYLSLGADLRFAEDRMQAAENLPVMELKDAEGVAFERVVKALLRRAPVIIAVSVIGAAAAFGITSRFATPMYQSSAMFYVNNNSINLNDVAKSIASGDISASRKLVDSYIVILNTRETLNKVIEHADSDLSYEEVKSMLNAVPVNDTEIFKVTVRSDSPKEAERIANAIAAVFPDRISEIIQGTAAKVVDYAVVPSRPSSPSSFVNGILGFIMGFVLIVLIILMRVMRDRTIHAEADVTQIAQLTMLAAIPDLGKNRKKMDSYGE